MSSISRNRLNRFFRCGVVLLALAIYGCGGGGGGNGASPPPPVVCDTSSAGGTPTTNRAYVTNVNSGTISVIDTTTNSVTATITVGGAPAVVVAAPQSHRAFFTDLMSGNISVVDTSTNTKLNPIVVGSVPLAGFGIDNTAHKLFAADFSDAAGNLGHLSVVNIPDCAVATFSVGTKLQDIAVDATVGKAYVTDFGDGATGHGSVKVIQNSAVAATLTSTPKSTNSHGVAVDVSNDLLLVTNLGEKTVSIFTLSSGAFVTTIAVGNVPQSVDVYPAIHRAYVTNDSDGTVSVINTSNNTVVTTVTVGASPQGIAVNTSSGMVYVTNETSGTVSVIDSSNNTVAATIPVGSHPVRVAVAP